RRRWARGLWRLLSLSIAQGFETLGFSAVSGLRRCRVLGLAAVRERLFLRPVPIFASHPERLCLKHASPSLDSAVVAELVDAQR
ncbi:MAG: hypothetical protein KIH71_010840, partial [Roseobacter sp.]|nr:hypothetical protein [Roseobacter sp.]